MVALLIDVAARFPEEISTNFGPFFLRIGEGYVVEGLSRVRRVWRDADGVDAVLFCCIDCVVRQVRAVAIHDDNDWLLEVCRQLDENLREPVMEHCLDHPAC